MAISTCGLPAAGGPCKRTPGHGGKCHSGIAPLAYLPTAPGTLLEFHGTWGSKRRRWYRRILNRATIRISRNLDILPFAVATLLAIIFAQIAIDIYLLIHAAL